MYSLQPVSKHLYKMNARSATTDIDKFNIRWSFFSEVLRKTILLANGLRWKKINSQFNNEHLFNLLF